MTEAERIHRQLRDVRHTITRCRHYLAMNRRDRRQAGCALDVKTLEAIRAKAEQRKRELGHELDALPEDERSDPDTPKITRAQPQPLAAALREAGFSVFPDPRVGDVALSNKEAT